MEPQHRRLVVVRHAKSEWLPGVPDRARALAPRGESDAPRMGARLRELVGGVDVAVVSPARRAQQTWELISTELGPVADERTDDRIYDEWGAGLLAVVRDLPDEARTAVLVGHEPGLSDLVLTLADDRERDLRERIDAKFPTCAVAVLSLAGAWPDWHPGAASLDLFTTPKG